MAYSPLPAKTASDTLDLSDYNQIKDNFAAGVPDLFTTKGDLAVGTGADTAVRVGIGSDGSVPVADSAEASGIAWKKQPAVLAYHDANQTLTATAWVTLAFNSERFDTESMHSNVTNNSRLTIPSGCGGVYMVGGCVKFSAGSYVGLQILLNGATVIGQFQNVEVGTGGAVSIATSYEFSAGDYIELQAYCASAANASYVANYSPAFWAIWQRIS